MWGGKTSAEKISLFQCTIQWFSAGTHQCYPNLSPHHCASSETEALELVFPLSPRLPLLSISTLFPNGYSVCVKPPLTPHSSYSHTGKCFADTFTHRAEDTGFKSFHKFSFFHFILNEWATQKKALVIPGQRIQVLSHIGLQLRHIRQCIIRGFLMEIPSVHWHSPVQFSVHKWAFF